MEGDKLTHKKIEFNFLFCLSGSKRATNFLHKMYLYLFYYFILSGLLTYLPLANARFN